MEEAAQEEAPREEAAQEEAAREEAAREGAPQEEAPREGAAREEAPREEAPQEGAPQEEAPQTCGEDHDGCSGRRSALDRSWIFHTFIDTLVLRLTLCMFPRGPDHLSMTLIDHCC